ncbi:acyltransferase family protein [Aquisediminimonas profunda]|uniref:acyltransferase family protein n=1 Tax=Aquisediminimonas profunda TaxID=1550733 RepID=UPI001C62F830|nr:acyltransferase family protein [Aquisediminimonas profunda]
MKWIDIARGVGIILVVYAHAARGLVHVNMLPSTGWPIYFDTVIYAFHMPLFFILAGLNIERGVARGRREFILNKLQTVAWPYFLWSFVHGSLKIASAGYTNNPITSSDLLAIPLVPIEQFWFLYVLFLCQLAIALILPRRWLLLALTLLAVVVWCSIPSGSIFFRALHFLPYVVLGIFAPPLLARLAARPAAQLAVAAGAWAWFAALILPVGPPAHDALTIYALAVLGSVATIATVMWLGVVIPSMTWLEVLGRLSMPIFLMHTIFSAATRAGLQMAGLADPILALVLVTVAGLLLPLFAYRIAVALNVTRLLGFGPPVAR